MSTANTTTNPVTPAVETPAPAVVDTVTTPTVETPTSTSTTFADPYLTSFDFDTWDGEVDKVDEPYRPVLSKVGARIKHERGVTEAEAKRLTDFYTGLLSSDEPVDIAKLKQIEADYQALKASMEPKESEILELKAKLGELTAAEAARYEAEIVEFRNNFNKNNKDIVSDKTKADAFVAALEADFDIDDAVVLARADAKLRAKAMALKSEGIPSAKAVHFAKLELGVVSQPEPSSDDLVGGANGDSVSGKLATVVNIADLPLDAAREAAFERAARRNNR